ncbi:transport and Golgi organization protein 1 homolog isoform X1 [Oryctolagus cuniculus]|uniref:transport and Golgi organization protein 1 homolog isoform X1 n=1 Tax=Oryctolagus cuniculus TaxID=9986 RepID=UPI0038797738
MEVRRWLFWILVLGFPSSAKRNIGHIIGFFPKLFNRPFPVYPKDLGCTSKLDHSFEFVTQQFNQPFHKHPIEDLVFTSKMVEILQCRFHFGLHCLGIFQKLIVGVFLGISTFKIFFWRTKLALFEKEKSSENLKRNMPEVKITIDESLLSNMMPKFEEKEDNDRKVEDTNNLVNDLIQSPYAKLPPGTDLNAKKHDLSTEYHDEAKEAKWEALRSSICELEEDKKNLEENCHTLSSALAEKDADYKLRNMTLNSLYENHVQRKMTLTRELARRQQEQMESERKLLEKEENLKQAEEELKKYKRKIQELQARREQQRSMFRNQIAFYAQKDRENRLSACAFEQEVMKRRKELVYLHHRLEIMEMQRMAEEYWRWMPAPGRMIWGSTPGRGRSSWLGGAASFPL